MIQVGQAKWTEKGHLISNLWNVWDSKLPNINIIFVVKTYHSDGNGINF